MWLFFYVKEDLFMSRRANGEGSIYKRQDGRWCASYYDENYKRHYIYGTTKKEVRKKLQERQLEETIESKKDYLLKDWIKEYLVNYKKNEVKATTYGSYTMLYRKHIENDKLGSILISQLRANDLQKYYNAKIAEGYNAKTVRHIEVIINCALQQAFREKLITENPNLYTVLPKRKTYKANVLTPEEVKKLVNEAKEEAIYPIVITALFTGLRKGELMGLTWNESIDFEKNRIHVVKSLCRISHEPDASGHGYNSYELMEPKSEKSVRYIPMLDIVREVLLQQKEKQDREKEQYKDIYIDRGLVFAKPDGTILNQRAFMNEYHAMLKKYGVTDCRFHDLRHCFASLLLTSGTGMKVTSELLGHSTISTSMNIYSHVYDETKVAALEKLNNLIE